MTSYFVSCNNSTWHALYGLRCVCAYDMEPIPRLVHGPHHTQQHPRSKKRKSDWRREAAAEEERKHGPEPERVPDRVRGRRRDAAGVPADGGDQHAVHRRGLRRPPLRPLRQGRLHLPLMRA